jgi:hypothetical protein
MFRSIHNHHQGVLFKALIKVKVICWPSLVYLGVGCVGLRWWGATDAGRETTETGRSECILIQCNFRILKIYVHLLVLIKLIY